MQMILSTTPVTRCESLAQYTVGALRRFVVLFAPPPEKAAQLLATADALEAGIDVLSSRQSEYRAHVLACIGPRLEVKLVDLKADTEVRHSKLAVDAVSKTASFAVFPDGITPIVKPVGQSEVDGLRALEGRMTASASHWPDATAWQGRIASVRVLYETALKSRTDAMSAAANARALRNAAKEDFVTLYAKANGAIKMIFPRERAVQDIFFDEVRGAAGEDAEPDDAEPVTGA